MDRAHPAGPYHANPHSLGHHRIRLSSTDLTSGDYGLRSNASLQRTTRPNSLGPGRLRLRQGFAVDFDRVDALVVETDQVFDLRALGYREGIAPGHIAFRPVAQGKVEVNRSALVRALGDGVGLAEQVHSDVHPRQVITRR